MIYLKNNLKLKKFKNIIIYYHNKTLNLLTNSKKNQVNLKLLKIMKNNYKTIYQNCRIKFNLLVQKINV